MSSPSRNKGTRFESLITDYLQHYFPRAERRALAGNADAGDIAGIHDLVIQCKDRKAMSLGAWLDDAHHQADIADVTFGVVAHKRIGKGAAGAQFITMSVEDFARLYHLLLQLEHGDIVRRSS